MELRGEVINRIHLGADLLEAAVEQCPQVNMLSLTILGLDVHFRQEHNIELTDEELEGASRIVCLSWTATELEDGSVMLEAPLQN